VANDDELPGSLDQVKATAPNLFYKALPANLALYPGDRPADNGAFLYGLGGEDLVNPDVGL
jgi:hypothetical protein